MKKILALALVLLFVLSLTSCVAAPGASQANAYEGMTPEAAAEKAADDTADKTSISDIIRVPFGYLLDWLYEFTANYGVALILFSLIVKIVLLPMGIKSKKSMLKMTRISPQVKALEAKYGDDKQKYQMAVQQLYKEEGVSMGGGCLWSFIPLLILLPLYYVIREPITYMLHNSRSVSAAIVAYIQASGVDLGKNSFYAQLSAASHIGQFTEGLKSLAVTAAANLKAIDFSFLGLNLAAIPTFKVWECEGWAQIGLFLIPIISGAFQMLSMLISQKMSNQIVTNADGEQDKDATKTANQTNMTMMLMMPLMSLWIGYSMPAAISIYWVAQAILGTVQEYFLTIHFRKVYEEEDAIKQELAAKRRAEEAEKEAQRQIRREQNPDGIQDNVSKKKQRQQEKEAAERAAREYEARINPQAEQDEDKPLSGDPERPYCRGRAYRADRYSRKSGGSQVSDETKE